jgi:lysyl-tRNA synthetase class 2
MASSVIDLITFEESRSELTVTFATGKTYVYALVPQSVYDDFRNSRSKGNFFNTRIRDRYPARQAKSVEANSAPQDWNAALESLNKK